MFAFNAFFFLEPFLLGINYKAKSSRIEKIFVYLFVKFFLFRMVFFNLF